MDNKNIARGLLALIIFGMALVGCTAPQATSPTPALTEISNPLLLEDALVRHLKLRIWLAHAGWRARNSFGDNSHSTH